MGFLSSLFGIKGSQPKTSTVVQAQKLPEEISPFVKEILGEAQDLYKAEIERGYDPYTGETIAPLTAEEETAFAGISGLAGTTTPFLEEALGTYRGGAEKFTPEVAEEYKSPYQRAVTDIEKREAQTAFEKDVMPKFEASAIAAGGLSGLGTRAGVEAAELQRGQSQLLADIEAKGQQRAFEDARKGFESQKARERQMAGDVGRIGPALFQAGLAEQGALQAVGEQKRGLGQSALDEAYFRFLEEKQFPKQTLADYSGMVYANPMAGLTTQTDTTTGTPFVPSTGQQMLGMGLAGLNVFGMAGGFSPGGPSMAKLYGNKEGGLVLGREEGGPVLSRQGGGAGEPRTIAEARKMGKNYFINKDGKKLAAVTKEELDASGLSLTEFLNQPTVGVEPELHPDLSKKEVPMDTSQRLAHILRELDLTKGTLARDPAALATGAERLAAEEVPPLAPTTLEPIGGRPVTVGGLAMDWSQRLGETEREEYKRRQDEYEAKVKRDTFNQLMQSITPGKKPAFTYGGSPAWPEMDPDVHGEGLGTGYRERDLKITNRLTDQYDQYIRQQAINNALSGSEPTPTRVSPTSQQMDTMRDATARGAQLGQMKTGIGEDYFGAFFSPQALDVATDPVTGGSFMTLDGQAIDLGYNLKHGGGLSQLANGGPVVYRQQGQIVGPRGMGRYPVQTAQNVGSRVGLGNPRGGHNVRAAQQAWQQRQAASPSPGRRIAQHPKGMAGAGFGLQALTPLGQSPGRRIAQHGQQGAFATTLPGGGAGGGAGGPIGITDTVTQTIQRLGKNFLAPRESLSSRVDAAQKRLGETKGFSETVMTESFTDYQTKLKTLQKRMNAKNKAKRTEFNKADEKASTEFFAAQEKAIKSGNNADIIAGAMDEANQRQIKQGGGTIAQWLTDIANVGVKGIGARRKEQGKELRELAKEKYKEARSDRKTNRGEELAEINKESLQDAKNLVDKYGFSKELASMDRATRTAAYAEIAAMAADERAELTQVEMMAKLLDVLGKGKKGAGKQEKFTSELKLVKERVAARYNYTIDEATGSIKVDKDTFLTASDPNYQKIKDEIDADWRTFLNKQDPSNTTVQGFLSILGPAGATTQASGGSVPVNTIATDPTSGKQVKWDGAKWVPIP